VGADVYVLEFVVFMYGRGGVAPWLVAFFDAFRRRVGRPLILNVHEIYRPRRSGVKGTVLSWMSRKCYEAAVWGCASAVVTNSYRERLLRELPGVDSKRVTRIPVGTNIPAARIRSRASRDREELYITSFGLWNQDRAIEELVHAVSAVTSPRPLRLFLVGGYGNEERRVERIRRLAAELGLEGRVEITGPLSAGAVSGYLARSDIFVSPEAAGPSGRRGSLIAAYAHGLPVVAYDGREREDVFRDGDNIIVVPEGDASSLATAVERLAGNDALRRTMGERARATFDEYFAWPRIAEQWDREVFVRVAEAL
jgi:glycosyltransferase involved in cell wall biosynthesis